MKLKTQYPTFDKAMLYFKLQCQSSIDAAREDYPLGSILNAQELWDALKPRVTYCDDPDDTELFQSYGTLFYDNHHGHSGWGDCDCFTVATVAVCHVSRLRCQIVLAGRSKKYPVHIYALVEGVIFDLTQPRLGMVRKYPYIQRVDISL